MKLFFIYLKEYTRKFWYYYGIPFVIAFFGHGFLRLIQNNGDKDYLSNLLLFYVFVIIAYFLGPIRRDLGKYSA